MARRPAGMVCVGLAILGILLAACGTQSPTRTSSPTATIQPTPTATPMPTSGSWHSAANWPSGTSAVSDIAFAQSAPQAGYLCTNLAQVPQTSSRWLYKTNDGGMTWTPVGGISTPAVNEPAALNCSIFVDASDANDVFAQLLLLPTTGATGEEPPVSETLWRSRDGGTNWQQLSMPQFFRGWAAITVVGARIVALAEYSQQVAPLCDATDPSNAGPLHQVDDLYASDDGGKTWKTIGQSLISKGLSISAASMGGATPSILGIGTTLFVQTFCLAQQGSNTVPQQTYWRSTDTGDSWTALAFPAGIIQDMRFTLSPTGSFYGVAIVEAEPVTSEPTTSQLLYSSDSGATWKALPGLNTLPGVQSSQLYAHAQNIIALPDGSVLAEIVAGSGPNTAVSQLFVVHPQGATPTWQQYAPSKGGGSQYDGGWEIASTSQGLVLWGWEYGASLQHAVYLSPLP